jgi:hypothetical protein
MGVTDVDQRKTAILQALRKFAHQRPGLDYANYGDPVAYRAEARSILRDLRQAEEMLGAVSWRDSITADSILDAAKNAFSGRLTITESTPGEFTLDYCTGQYWPTEYRRAVCSVLSSALWDYWRNTKPDSTGDYIRKCARAELSRGIANRWFN